MKVFSYIFNFILVIGTVIYVAVVGIQSMKPMIISTSLEIKKLNSSELVEFDQNQKIEEEEIGIGEIEKVFTVSDKHVDVSINKEEVVTEEVSSLVEESTSDVLETQVGSLSGYGPDCVGCSGFLASGLDVRGGNIYYFDSTYGNVRILAGDRSYPYGTIVRVKNSRLSEFIGIVLDRGGAIGFGKRHLFDLLYSSSTEALKNEVSYNTTFEILRYGY